MSQQHQQGQFLQADFFNNSGGLNVTDSPIRVLDEQAIGGYNYEYGLTGAFRKRRGANKLNSSPDGQTRHLGTGLLRSYDGTSLNVRAAGTKVQVFTGTGATTNLTTDVTSPASDLIPSNQTAPTMFAQFNSASKQILWLTGSGITAVYGVYSSTKITQHGVPAPTGTVTTAVAVGTSTFLATGKYFYTVLYRKASTQALSNAALDVSATIANTTDAVTISVAGLTGLDQTKIDKIYIYRSALSGASGFTTGDLIAQINSSVTSFVDTGSAIADAENIPRSGNIVLDNGTLPSGTPVGLTVWKRRLVSAINSTIYYSDTSKPESWPLTNTLQIPSGGPITGLAIISFNTPTTATGTDELLVIFKDSECWIATGLDYTDIAIRLVDRSGCINQSLAVNANGFLFWIDYRGIYVWDGSGKPIYCSRPIEYQFSPDGTLDKGKLSMGWGTFYKKTNQVVWYLSDTLIGEQQYSLKLDLRLTLPNVSSSLGSRILDGVFIQDKSSIPLYGGMTGFPTFDEVFYSGDASGYIYNLFVAGDDAGAGIDFSYMTKTLDLGLPSQTKRFHKIIVWLEDSSDANLTLDYWLTYKTDDASKSTQSQPITRQVTRAVWDLAYWDSASWDSNLRTYSPLVFNLSGPKGTEGEALTLQFRQPDANTPVTIVGFSIIYSLAGLRK